MLKPDTWIIQNCLHNKLIHPFNTGSITEMGGHPIISRGASSYGYDIALAEDNFKLFVPLINLEMDAKNLNEQCLLPADVKTAADGSRYFILPPHSYALGMTVESFQMPRDVLAIAFPKATLTRAGIMVNVSPIEPEWSGRLVMQIGNLTPLPNRLYIDEGIAQIIFFGASDPCDVSYYDRKGGYMNQQQI